MYPAIEIDLHLDRICAAQRQSPAALDATFQALKVRHQPAPPSTQLQEERLAADLEGLTGGSSSAFVAQDPARDHRPAQRRSPRIITVHTASAQLQPRDCTNNGVTPDQVDAPDDHDDR